MGISPLTEIQKQMEELQQRFHKCMNLARIGDWSFAPETNAFWRSSENLTLYLLTPDSDLTRNAFLEIVHENDRKRVAHEFETIIREKTSREFDFRITRPDGEVRWIRSVIRAAYGFDRCRVRLEGLDQDITTQKETELELRASEERFRVFFERASDALFLHGDNGVILAVNQRACESLGYGREELIGSDVSKFDLDVTVARMSEIGQKLTAGEAITFETRHQRRDGTWFPVEVRLFPFADRGRLLAISLAQDISQRRRAEEDLRIEQQFSQAILDNAAVVIVVLDQNGRIVRLNRAAERLSGYSFAEVAGRRPSDVMGPLEQSDITYREAFDEQFVMSPGGTSKHSSSWLTKDGKRRLLEWHKTELRQDERQTGFSIAVGVDVTEHHQTETALREREGTLRAIFESDPNCIKLLDREFLVQEMNPAGLAMLGATSVNQVRGQSVLEFIAPSDRDRVCLDVVSAFNGQRTLHQYQIVGLDGVSRYVEQHAVGLRDSGSPERISQVLAITRDVTEQHALAEIERKRVDKLRRLSRMALPLSGEPMTVLEKLLRVVSEVFDVPIVLLTEIRSETLNVRLAYINGEFHPHFVQYPLIASPCRLLVESQSVVVVNRVAEQFPGFELLKTTGAETYCGTPAVDAGGTVLGGLCLIDPQQRSFSEEDRQFIQLFGQRLAMELEREREQSLHRAVQESLRQSEQRLSEAQRIAHLGDWVWDISSDTITWSDEVYRIFGHEPQAFVPHYEVEFIESVPADDRPRVMNAVRQSLKDGEAYNIVHRIVRPDGVERIVRERGEVVYNDAGQAIRMLGTVQDITEATRSQEQMETLQRELTHVARLAMLGEMLTGIAHELNQPLAAIATNAYAARRAVERVAGDSKSTLLGKAARFSGEVEAQAVRAGEIIRRLISLLRKQSPRRTTVNLRKLIDEVVCLIASEMRAADVKVEIEVPQDLAPVLADPIQLQQVLLNLLRNSLESLITIDSRLQRKVTIEACSDHGGGTEIRVRDNGSGLDPSMEGRIFTPFATTKANGLGFGLAMTRRIIEAHGGDIHLHSQSGRGVEVRITLPHTDLQLETLHAE